MKKLQFRAWDGEKMHNNIVPWQWDFVIDTMSHKCIESTGFGIFGTGGKTAKMEVPAIRFEKIMQFTGLKDKNGNTYCADDIVKYNGKNYRLIQGNYSFELVGFWEAFQDNPSDFFSENAFLVAEIIGNIHENPELLK